jgi:phospholipid-binding lipoprotein MlaA
MKINIKILPLLLISLAPLVTSCSSARKSPAPVEPAPTGKATQPAGKSVQTEDELDEYAAVEVSDPLEPLNRVTFMLNHGIYTVLLKPVSKVYETIIPKFLRTGVHNAYENVKFPVRFVNHTLQGNFKRSGQETGKFLVNSVAGVGGLMQPAEKIPALANVPAADTGQTFAKWGIGHGPYIVLPILGPTTTRDVVGLAGDYALNPVSWVTIIYGEYVWTIAVPAANTMRSLPNQLAQYDAAVENAVDPYLSTRTAYIQYRAGVEAK